MLCYWSLAKLDPHTKSKTLVSHNRYGIVFMHGQNVMPDISARSQSFHFGLCLHVHLDPQSLLGLTSLVATWSPVIPSSDHHTMMLEKV